MPTSPPVIRRPAYRPTGRELVVETIAEHASSLLATARRYSLCADDAQDAYQRGLEIFLRHADGLDPAGAAPWLRTVIKHEALALRAARLRIVGPAEADLDLQEARELEPADERVSSFERLQRSAEALARLKPHEVRALVLKAHGPFVSYLSGQFAGTLQEMCSHSSVSTRRSLPLPPRKPTNDEHNARSSGRVTRPLGRTVPSGVQPAG